MDTAPRLDEIDQLILMLLRENGRRTVADIASRVNLSAAPVELPPGDVLLSSAPVEPDGRLGPDTTVWLGSRQDLS
jgi:hypothetical protein